MPEIVQLRKAPHSTVSRARAQALPVLGIVLGSTALDSITSTSTIALTTKTFGGLPKLDNLYRLHTRRLNPNPQEAFDTLAECNRMEALKFFQPRPRRF